MADFPSNAPKPAKDRKPTAQELHTNSLLYGPTGREQKPVAKKVDYGAAYLDHPKFQALIKAFRNGAPYRFEVSSAGRAYAIATANSEITVNGRVLCYSRPLNRSVDNLLLDRTTAVQLQDADPVVHLVFAVVRSFPELDAGPFTYLRRRFFHAGVALDAMPEEEGPNLLLGAFHNAKFRER